MAAEQEQPYYYCAACPAATNCSNKSWRNAKCWGSTPEECIAQLRHHLTHSSRHYLSNTEVDGLLQGLKLEFYDPSAEKERGGKKQKNPASGSASRSSASLEDYTRKEFVSESGSSMLPITEDEQQHRYEVWKDNVYRRQNYPGNRWTRSVVQRLGIGASIPDIAHVGSDSH